MHIARFDPNDCALIEGAVLTRQPADVAAALDAAIDGFRARLKKTGIPHIDGRPRLLIYKPATAFDAAVLRAVVQVWADTSGEIIDVHYLPNPNRVGSPDVKFI